MTDWAKIGYGTLTVVLLVSLGVMVIENDTHFCRSRELSMECNRLSSTGKTCYPTPGINIGSKLCPEGWEEIGQEKEVIYITTGDNALSYQCDSKGCVRNE